MPAPITITTDFGLEDGYVGTMKGVILSIAPDVPIVDITHAIRPQNIRQAIYILSTATPYFPRNTVHIVVVDPGVGTERRPIAVFTERATYIGPDNGVFSGVYRTESVREIRQLSNPAYRLPRVSNTFHGRDIFAPAAAHLVRGVAPADLGPRVTDPVTIPLPAPERRADGSLHGQVIHADRFGNLITDIPEAWLEGRTDWIFTIGGRRIVGFHSTYGRVAPGELLVLGGSDGLIEVAVREGNAAAFLGIGPGAAFSAYPADASAILPHES
jgi:S-adenosylmethionine hydrolase